MPINSRCIGTFSRIFPIPRVPQRVIYTVPDGGFRKLLIASGPRFLTLRPVFSGVSGSGCTPVAGRREK